MKRRDIQTDRKGDIPILAVFAIFSILIAGTTIAYIRTTRKQTAQTIRKHTAADITRARASAIEKDLNETLYSSITASMWKVGIGGGARENVENKIIEILNKRIEEGWKYSVVRENIPPVNENLLHFLWQPDGSLIVYGVLDAKIVHLKGPSVYGLELYSQPEIRFQRIKKVAELVMDKLDNVSDIDRFESRINENYRAEGLEIEILFEENSLVVEVEDIFGGQTVIRPS